MAIRRITGTVQYNPTSNTTTISSPNSDVSIQAASFTVQNVATNPTFNVHATGTVGGLTIFVDSVANIKPGIAVSGAGVFSPYSTVTSVDSVTRAVGVSNPNDSTFDATVTFTDYGTGAYSPSSYAMKITSDAANVGNPNGIFYDPNNIYDSAEHRQQGAVYIAGGLGVEKDLNVGGFIYGRISEAVTSTQLTVTSTNVDSTFYPTFVQNFASSGGNVLYGDNTGPFSGLTYNPAQGKLTTEQINVSSSTQSTSTTTGALTVKGGVGIEGNLTVDDIYTKVLSSLGSKIQIKPEEPITEIYGDIRVLNGNNPIGTAPVVTNVLYVTMDGDDTNDGRAMDPSRACRTITGAVNSPYYQSGTQIRVSPGFYLEDNPIRLKPYTSVMGSDIRTTSIEPINKTQDLFHLESGCYLAFMQFLNGRSGLLEGNYTPGTNRGAYCTAFPPLEGDQRIDLFHSPYVQNCTNLSGPWLRDGTLFTPNQTVQIPLAVGTGTWASNTTSIVVNVDTGAIELGMAINAGQQNPGFFNARTLMLANKKFLQEQVVAFVDDTFNSGSFTYNTTTCYRDVGLIVDSISLDLLYQSTSESVFAGLQYWNQSGSAIPGEETTTTAAISYLKSLANATIIGAGGTVSDAGLSDNLFDNIVNIITYGTFNITDTIESNGYASSTASIVASYDALIAAIPTYQTQVVNWIDANYPSFVYNTSTCARDVQYIVESVAFDLLHSGNKQSTKSGVYYYGYDETSTAVPTEIPQVTAAYNFIKAIIPNIVKSQTILNPQQLIVPQVTSANYASDNEVAILQDNIDIITNIIRNGPSVASNKEPIGLTSATNTLYGNAYDLLVANRTFIQAEVIAYIDNQFNSFDYAREYCYRDVGILVEDIAYDAAFGGNQKSIESGLAYYDGVISKIAGQETQTVSAIDYLNQMIQSIVINNTWTNILPVPQSVAPLGTSSQVINTALVNGGIVADSLDHLFNIVTDIISNGPDAAPEVYTSTGPDAAYVSAEILMQANRTFIQEDTINYINNQVKQFPYGKAKCKRDVGIILDSIANDMRYPTPEFSQSNFAGLQYWSQDGYTGEIGQELAPTISAVSYLKELSRKTILHITEADDAISGVTRYQTGTTQVTTIQPGTAAEVSTVNGHFDNIISIVGGNRSGWTDRIVPNGDASELLSVQQSYDLLQLNKTYFQEEVIAYIDTTLPGFTYSSSTCKRDIGYIIDSVCFDLLHSGNRQSIQAGLSYYAFTATTSTVQSQEVQTVAAFNYLSSLTSNVIQNISVTPLQTKVTQNVSLPAASASEAATLAAAINTVTSIISGGPSAANALVPISLTADTATNVTKAWDILQANKEFLKEEVIAWIDQNYNSTSFQYNEEKCYRDVGLIIDAVSQDILLGGNQRSVEAGQSYWNLGFNYVDGQVTTTTLAINYARDLALDIIANTPVTPQTQTNAVQIINQFFQYGGDYMPQQAVTRNFGIITNIIENGPIYAPPTYAGGGVFALTGINGLDVKIAPTVTSVSTITTGTYLVGLSAPTVGFGNNATLYFGNTAVYPALDDEVDALSLELTGSTSTWHQRKIDPIGSMGGSLVDGAVISTRSPIQSFVYDAFTQLTQGGRGIHITNDGYAQLVSVFTIFSSVGVQTDNGGIASIVNSNANFGDICLLSKGYGKRKFSGTVFNPPYKAYPRSPGPEGLDQYFPFGYWPTGGKVEVFIPNLDNRPHISLVMEVEAPTTYFDVNGNTVPFTNEQGFPGFLNANISRATLNTGTITITDIDTDGVYVGNTVYIRDQNNSQTGPGGNMYAATGTVVVDVGYRSITLSKALTDGGSDPTFGEANTDWFKLYFCGNSYYTVLSSTIAENPTETGTNILAVSTLTGITVNQVPAHIDAIQHLNTVVDKVVTNQTVTPAAGTTATQVIDLGIVGGENAISFIDQRFTNMVDIIGAVNLTAAENVVPAKFRTASGTIPTGAGSAIALINSNREFILDEVTNYVINTNLGGIVGNYNAEKCKRDIGLILTRLIYDLETGGNRNSVLVGLSYWSRPGAHHIVQLGENVRRNDLFPDGAVINFYQRSYISASGYVFEYVGAGTNYGSLPQVGRADPVQGRETVQLNSGKVFFTSTDQNGDFRIGPGLVISQATGVLSGRTFTKSLFANMTPFILAIEGGGGGL